MCIVGWVNGHVCERHNASMIMIKVLRRTASEIVASNGDLLAPYEHEKQARKLNLGMQTKPRKQAFDELHDYDLIATLSSIERKCRLNEHMGYIMWET